MTDCASRIKPLPVALHVVGQPIFFACAKLHIGSNGFVACTTAEAVGVIVDPPNRHKLSGLEDPPL